MNASFLVSKKPLEREVFLIEYFEYIKFYPNVHDIYIETDK